MNYNITSNLPGILGLLDYSPQSGIILRELAEKVLRDEDFSQIPVGYRELIASETSQRNGCNFCHQSHLAAAVIHLGKEEVSRVLNEKFENGEKVSAYMTLARDVAFEPERINKKYVDSLKEDFSITDREVHDVILIVSMFEMYNRYVTASGVSNPKLNGEEYMRLGQMVVEEGYA